MAQHVAEAPKFSDYVSQSARANSQAARSRHAAKSGRKLGSAVAGCTRPRATCEAGRATALPAVLPCQGRRAPRVKGRPQAGPEGTRSALDAWACRPVPAPAADPSRAGYPHTSEQQLVQPVATTARIRRSCYWLDRLPVPWRRSGWGYKRCQLGVDVERAINLQALKGVSGACAKEWFKCPAAGLERHSSTTVRRRIAIR